MLLSDVSTSCRLQSVPSTPPVEHFPHLSLSESNLENEPNILSCHYGNVMHRGRGRARRSAGFVSGTPTNRECCPSRHLTAGVTSVHCLSGRKQGFVLFNNTLNTFYLRLYGIRHMVKNHSDSEKGNPLLPHRLLFLINSKGSFICTIPQTG